MISQILKFYLVDSLVRQLVLLELEEVLLTHVGLYSLKSNESLQINCAELMDLYLKM